MQDIAKRLDELINLKEGWDGYNGKPVSPDTAQLAMYILNSIYLPDMLQPQIVPSAGGDLQIEWHSQNFDIELHIAKRTRS